MALASWAPFKKRFASTSDTVISLGLSFKFSGISHDVITRAIDSVINDINFFIVINPFDSIFIISPTL